MAYRTVDVVRTDSSVRVTLARPRQQNSIDRALLDELDDVLSSAERDPKCRLVVLAGTGGVFSAGMDLHAAGRSGPGADELVRDSAVAFLALMRRFTQSSRVVVSVVDGRVAGGGLGLVAASDLVYATRRGTFALPEALWGLLPCCVLPFLVRRIGVHKAYTMTLTTQQVSAVEAERCQLVDEVCDDVEPVLRRLLVRLTRLEDAAITRVKQHFEPLRAATAQEQAAAVDELVRLLGAPEARERIAAFARDERFPWERRGEEAVRG